MKENFKDVHAGGQISAREFNKLTNRVEEVGGASPGYGEQELDIGGVRGKAKTPRELIMVRITGIVIPESSELYADSLTYHTDAKGNTGEDAYTAVLQRWDNQYNKWVDDATDPDTGDKDGDPSCVNLVVLDDRTGWRPLVVDDVIPCVWKKEAGKYVPLETREAAVTMITGALDSDGFYPGAIMVWDSDTKTWKVRGLCWILPA